MVITDVMVDIETTGTRSGYSSILQIAAVKFNIDTGEFDPAVFDRCPERLPNRFWDDGTAEFWGKFPKVYQGFVARQEEARKVFEDLAYWVSGYPKPLRFWSKPLSFDWPMLASHYEQLGLEMPFHYRTARDVNTYIACCNSMRADHVDMKHIEDAHNGALHNALSDCVLQIKMLMAAKNGGSMPAPTPTKLIEDAEYEEVTQ